MNTSPTVTWIDEADGDFVRQFDEDQQRMADMPVVTKDDPLALSWASYGVWKKSPNRRWVPLSDVEAYDHDRHMADVTKKYYRDKLAMQALKRGGESTEFQRDLYEICNGGTVRQKHIGMIYKLPYFYEEDISRGALKRDTKHGVDQAGPTKGTLTVRDAWQLWSDRRIFSSRKRLETMEYWFRNEHGHAVVWKVPYGNELRSLVDGIFDRPNRYNMIRADYRAAYDERWDFTYWRLFMPEVVFDE